MPDLVSVTGIEAAFVAMKRPLFIVLHPCLMFLLLAGFFVRRFKKHTSFCSLSSKSSEEFRCTLVYLARGKHTKYFFSCSLLLFQVSCVILLTLFNVYIFTLLLNVCPRIGFNIPV